MPDLTFIIVVAAAVAASLVVQLILYRLLKAGMKAEAERLAGRVDEGLGAGAKFLEVQNYYEDTSREIRRLIGEGTKEGNRQRVDQFRRMRDRLEALRSRVVDKTVNLINGEKPPPKKRRRRRRRPSNKSGGGSAATQDRSASSS